MTGDDTYARRRRLKRTAVRAAGPILDDLRRRGEVGAITTTDDMLEVTYDLRVITLETLLGELDFDRSAVGFLTRMGLALAGYREARQLENLNSAGGWDSIVRKIYLALDRNRQYGRQQERPSQLLRDKLDTET